MQAMRIATPAVQARASVRAQAADRPMWCVPRDGA